MNARSQKIEKHTLLDPGLKAEVVVITPALAETLLEKNPNNRSLNKRSVERLTKAIKNREWVLNGEPIILDEEDNLIDGQHRLRAVIAAGESIHALVVRGVRSKAFDTIDIGRPRSMADILSIKNEGNPTKLAAAVRLLYCWEKAIELKVDMDWIDTPSYKTLERVLEANHGLSQSVVWPGRARQLNKILPSAPIGTLHYLFSKVDSQAADYFFTKLAEGTDLPPNSPILTLREHYLRYPKGGRKRNTELFKNIISAWNAYRQGRELKQIRTPEKMPEIV